MAEKISAAQRAQFFAMATRQNIQTMGVKRLENGSQIIDFELPKARYLSKIWLKISAILNCKHPSATEIETDFFTGDNIIRRVSMNFNNSFMPYNVSGSALKLTNMLRLNSHIYRTSNVLESLTYLPDKLKCSVDGVDNEIELFYELPVTLNDRDGIGYILLQNSATLVNLKLEFSTSKEILDYENLEINLKDVMAEPTLETFSIPADERATPDLSVIKILETTRHSFMSSGKQVIRLSCGKIYRKMIFQFKKENGAPFSPDDFNSNLELVFNTADCNYSISPKTLRYINTLQYGSNLPNGVYVLDFSAMQGFPNYSGSRDFVDTEKLTELTMNVNVKESGYLDFTAETISRLR